MDLKTKKRLFPWISESSFSVSYVGFKPSDSLCVRYGISKFDLTSLYDKLVPVNPVTGHRDSDLTVLLSSSTPDCIKEALSKTLVEQSSPSLPSNISFEDAINNVVSRYDSTLGELQQAVSNLDANLAELRSANTSHDTREASSETSVE